MCENTEGFFMNKIKYLAFLKLVLFVRMFFLVLLL